MQTRSRSAGLACIGVIAGVGVVAYMVSAAMLINLGGSVKFQPLDRDVLSRSGARIRPSGRAGMARSTIT
jgi:hypothetical protein